MKSYALLHFLLHSDFSTLSAHFYALNFRIPFWNVIGPSLTLNLVSLPNQISSLLGNC